MAGGQQLPQYQKTRQRKGCFTAYSPHPGDGVGGWGRQGAGGPPGMWGCAGASDSGDSISFSDNFNFFLGP